MRTHLLIGALALGLVITDPAICAQNAPPPAPDGSQPMPGEAKDPADPNPMPDPSNPTPPITEPLPPEMPMPAGDAQQTPEAPVIIDRSLPPGPAATPPSANATVAVSGSTTTTMMTPQAATKDYPPCSRTLQDNCINPGERVKAGKRPR